MTNNKEKKSSIIKDAIALTIITVICSFALAFVYEITKTPIKEQEEAKKNAGYKAVFADADKLFTDEELVSKAAETDLSALDSDLAGVTVGDVIQALDENGNLLGYIVTSKTRGYASTINLAIGYSLDGTVKGIEFLEIGESVGFGANADSPEFKSKFTGVKADHFTVTKGNSSSETEIDVYSGATVTTTAVVKAVNGAIAFLKEYAEGLGGAANE